MLKTSFRPAFVRDMKRCVKKHRDMALVEEAMRAVSLLDEEEIPESFKPHQLKGQWQGVCELHIGGRQSDWLLLYEVIEDTAYFIRTGSHDELF